MKDTKKMLLQALKLQEKGRLREAEAKFRKILTIDPNNVSALYSLSIILFQSSRKEPALRLAARSVQVAPTVAPLQCLHATLLQGIGEYEAALKGFDEALKLDPGYIDACIESGILLRDLLRHREALDRFNKALKIDPNNVSALASCGILLSEFHRIEESITIFERLIKIQPDFNFALGLLEYERLRVCDWTDFEEMSKRIVEGIRAGKTSCKTLAFMAISDSAQDHLLAANIFSKIHNPPVKTKLWQGQRYQHDKIRVAYVSPDLRQHPVGHLLTGVIEQHDKSRFETIAISLGKDDRSRLRERMVKSFDQFIDATTIETGKLAQLMCDMEVDIAVDLGGYTSDSRPEIFVHRPSPVQVNFLGYPGTLGMEDIDYILADKHVIPEDQQEFYTEKVVYLPNTYLPTDASIKIPDRVPSRAECGLPESGFVFCSFSHDYKISPPVFDIWMRLLKQMPDSVLWLMSRSELSQRNLHNEAETRGVNPSRLVFAQRVPQVEDHLARYRQADLFLDTHPYNAHTTTADALMAGLPVLTYSGSSFPSRVAGSLLHAAGIPELITESLEDYEALALQLATTPNMLNEIKQKLADNKATCSLFDTVGFCRNLEAAYISMCKKD